MKTKCHLSAVKIGMRSLPREVQYKKKALNEGTSVKYGFLRD